MRKTAVLTELVCVDCGQHRLKNLLAYKGRTPLRCHSCANKARGGANNPAWKGGRIDSHSHGYVRIRLLVNDAYRPMASKQGYVFEHRLVMAKHLGRCLHSWEVVHHKNGNKADNRLANLLLLPNSTYHLSDNLLKSRLKELEKRVTLLEAENVLLKSQLADPNEEETNDTERPKD